MKGHWTMANEREFKKDSNSESSLLNSVLRNSADDFHAPEESSENLLLAESIRKSIAPVVKVLFVDLGK
jgi:hypothetical protein